MSEETITVIKSEETNTVIKSEETNTVIQERTIFVEDDVYKSIATFKEQIAGLPEYVYHVLFLRYNRHLLEEEEIRQVENTISLLKKEQSQESMYFQKLFEDNKENLIDCSVKEVV